LVPHESQTIFINASIQRERTRSCPDASRKRGTLY